MTYVSSRFTVSRPGYCVNPSPHEVTTLLARHPQVLPPSTRQDQTLLLHHPVDAAEPQERVKTSCQMKTRGQPVTSQVDGSGASMVLIKHSVHANITAFHPVVLV